MKSYHEQYLLISFNITTDLIIWARFLSITKIESTCYKIISDNNIVLNFTTRILLTGLVKAESGQDKVGLG